MLLGPGVSVNAATGGWSGISVTVQEATVPPRLTTTRPVPPSEAGKSRSACQLVLSSAVNLSDAPFSASSGSPDPPVTLTVRCDPAGTLTVATSLCSSTGAIPVYAGGVIQACTC